MNALRGITYLMHRHERRFIISFVFPFARDEKRSVALRLTISIGIAATAHPIGAHAACRFNHIILFECMFFLANNLSESSGFHKRLHALASGWPQSHCHRRPFSALIFFFAPVHVVPRAYAKNTECSVGRRTQRNVTRDSPHTITHFERLSA